MRSPLLLLALLLVALPHVVSAQVIQGELRESETQKPLPGGVVRLLTRDSVEEMRVVADTAGRFLLQASRPGSYRVGAELPGFQSAISPPLKLSANDTLGVEFLLSTETVLLEPLVVTARPRRSPALAGFYERLQRRAGGHFITREEIERRRPTLTTDLLRTLPGVRLALRPPGGGYHVLLRGNCMPTVFIDGAGGPMHGWTIDDLARPLDLEGIEIYPSMAEAPVEYTGLRGGCGVILLWTRRGD